MAFKLNPAKNMDQLAAANSSFAINLYNEVKDGGGENLFFSPLSISTAIAMTHLGARGDTATQIAEVFRFNQVEGDLHQAFKDMNAMVYQAQENYKLRAANKLYGKSGYHFVQSFMENVIAYYDSAVEAIDDFSAPSAAKSINDWVSKKTEGKITDLIAPGILNSLTRLVLVNAIYFIGNWASKFKPRLTKKDVFKVIDSRETVPVNLMFQSGKFLLAIDEKNDCLVLEMPYKGYELSMMIILPQQNAGLPKLEANLSIEVLASWGSKLRSRPVNIFMPKFKLEAQFLLKDKLQKIGMTDAFGSKANFEGISGDRELYVSSVIHKAFVDVNEEGSEAAAATAVVRHSFYHMPRDPEKPIEFRADHPFLFMIRHRLTQAILFVGRLMDPS